MQKKNANIKNFAKFFAFGDFLRSIFFGISKFFKFQNFKRKSRFPNSKFQKLKIKISKFKFCPDFYHFLRPKKNLMYAFEKFEKIWKNQKSISLQTYCIAPLLRNLQKIHPRQKIYTDHFQFTNHLRFIWSTRKSFNFQFKSI